MTRILVTGSSGFLGHNLLRGLCDRHELFGGYHSQPPAVWECRPVAFDITDASAVSEQLETFRPEVVVHAAAMAQPDDCENHPERANEVIVAGTRNIAEACGRISARLIHISTDLVFDGRRGQYTEEDEVKGTSVYSRAKIEAERIVQTMESGNIVLRIALLYGFGNASHSGTVAATIRSWRQGKALTFYTDQYRTPAFAPQVCNAVSRFLQNPRVSGIFHLGGGERISRFEFARLLAKEAGVSADLVRPGSMFDAPTVASRGQDCSLVSDKISRVLSLSLLRCSEALALMSREEQWRSR
jgi:dTDP-4-dehydrorhamnose reductase